MSKLNNYTIKIDYKNETIGERWLYCDQNQQLLFCDNETNTELLYKDKIKNKYYKDGINDYLIDKNKNSVNPDQKGTKSAALHYYEIEASQSVNIKMRLSNQF